MSAIYEPSGPAKEYSPLALNHYLSCSHGCKYCFAPAALRTDRETHRNIVRIKKNVLVDLRKDCKLLSGDPRNVLLCFLSDPYQLCEQELKLTRKCLEELQRYNLNATVLTKAGALAQRDFDLLKKMPGAEFAVTLTFDDSERSLEWEPGAGLPGERIANLKAAHAEGIRTWVSFEPVLDPEAVYRMIKEIHTFTDFFKVGKWNHDKKAAAINWPLFRKNVVQLLDELGCDYLIKKDLQEAK